MRKGKVLKVLAVLVAINLITEICYPTMAWALGGGPSQPEVQSFEPSSTSNMVDLFSGDFNYNIPLFDVEGYPINIAYHSGVSMDQEATWVGLGWNINPGAITRSVRGIPDEFNGDKITKVYNMKTNTDYGLNMSVGLELIGLDTKSAIGLSLNLGLGINFNNYKGVGYEFSISAGISAGSKAKNLNLNLGLAVGSQSGAGFNASLSANCKREFGDNNASGNIGIGASYNTRGGLKALTLSASMNISSTNKTEATNKANAENEANAAKAVANNEDPNDIKKVKPKVSTIGGAADHSYSMSFASPSYYPTISMPMKNTILTLSGSLGVESWSLNPNFGLSGYYMKQELRENVVSSPAYGYMYSENGRNSDNNIKDFNREKDLPYSEDIPNLPITNYTYDLYSISGQGTGGMFRPYRNDVGIVCDRFGSNTSSSTFIGVEVGLANLVKLGANLAYTYSFTNSGMWNEQNQLKDVVYFMGRDDLGSNVNKPIYEPYYLKVSGEKQSIDENYYNKLNGEEPVRIHLDYNYGTRKGKTGYVVAADNSYDYNDKGDTHNINTGIYRTNRELRSQVISYLTVKEADKLGRSFLDYYPINVFKYNTTTQNGYGYLDKNERKEHHIAEYTVTNPDGRRYVYGLPAYNTKQEEVSFSVSKDDNVNLQTGLVKYNSLDPNPDNSIRNKKGLDNYYNSVSTPPYAHSYLLTEILSTDYVDVTGNGVSDDDLGTSIKFDYSQPYTQGNPYKWRVPYDSANWDEGFKIDPLDNKATYLYGEKEIWYLHSVESSNFILEFYLSGRKDGIAVRDSNGGLGNDSLYQIDSISLYSKQDKLRNHSNAIPIKTVHFKYDYSLCNNVPNKLKDPQHPLDNGKLTLRKIWFTYGKSNKARLNSYEFNYSSFRPNYNLKGYDRWGNYKPHDKNLPNSENPYVKQDKTSADLYASAWCLNQILLPSGGVINIDYESDDYAYVQDKTAMQMFKILGVGHSNKSSERTFQLFNNKSSDYEPNTYIFFRLKQHMNRNTAKQIIKRDYLKGIDYLYYRCYTYLVQGLNIGEYVPGYAEIDTANSGLSSDSSDIGVIKLKTVGLQDKETKDERVNPIAKSAWQFLRLNLPQEIFGDKLASDGSMSINSLAGFWNNVKVMFKGYNKMLRNDGYGKNISPDKSWIRLNSPTMVKYGGGVRVKKISITDNWSEMGNDQPNYTYGQTYDYTKEITLDDGTIRTISSGVATYEPMLGGEENPLRQPVVFKKENLMAPDDFHYIEYPIGEIFYPSPEVGYSKVKVRNITPKWVKNHATGYTVTEFFTSKDFPTKVKQRKINSIRIKPEKLSLSSILGFDTYDYMYASQGYTVELNDMQGKMKAQYVYQENNDEPISSIQYEYFLEKNDTTSLSNRVTVIDPYNTVSQKYVGKEKDVVIDMRNQETTTFDPSLGINIDMFMVGIFPIPIPMLWPKMKIENTGYKSVVVTKIIQKYGIVKKTIVTDLGSKMTTENIAFDAYTGEPILTKVNNEFNDTIFRFGYPAHWIYEGMGLASLNIGAEFKDVSITNGKIVPPEYEQFFTPGDELLVYSNKYSYQGGERMWVLKSDNMGLIFINERGEMINEVASGDSITFKIIRSGRRNMLTSIVGDVTTMYNPVKNNVLTLNNNIINSTASQFSDDWQTYYKPIYKKCDSLNLLACNLEKLLNYLLKKPHKLYSLDEVIHNYDIACDSLVYNGLLNFDHLDYYCDTSKSSADNLYARLTGEKPFELFLNGHNLAEADTFFNIRLKPGDKNHLTFDFIIDAIIGGITITIEGSTTFDYINKCYCDASEVLNVGDTINPYLYGIKGNWRKKRDFVYITSRDQTTTPNNNSDIRADGLYDNYTPFWLYNSTSKKWNKSSDTNWVWSNEVSKYDPHGMELENKDPLNRHSGQLLGFNYSMTVALASNSKHNNLLFDGFEDYFYEPGRPLCEDRSRSNLNLSYADNHLTRSEHHSGWYSYQLNANDSMVYSRDIIDTIGSPYLPITPVYRLKAQDIIYGFSPDAQKYVISAWVKEKDSSLFNYNSGIRVVLYDNNIAVYSNTFHPSGNIIDGWQRIYGTFTIPSGSDNINIILKANSQSCYDDIRVHPYVSNMKSWVYDDRTLKVMAELDENNYAAFYEYDDEGQLVRIKKETSNGIMTIKEARSSLIKR